MQVSTAEGVQPKGLIKTLAASGIQASASGGWIAQETHQDQEAADALIEQLARKTIAESLLDMVCTLFLGKTDRFDLTDGKVKATAALVEDIVALVGFDIGLQLFSDRFKVLMSNSVQEKAKSGAGSPTKKAKTLKPKHHPHHNPKGEG